jgi:hypothetical protein
LFARAPPPAMGGAAYQRLTKDLPAAAREKAQQQEHQHDDQDDPENRHGGAPFLSRVSGEQRSDPRLGYGQAP